MIYSQRDALRHIAGNAHLDLTDDEVATAIAESGESIEASGRAVREAAQAYEAHVIRVAAEIISRRHPAPEVQMQSELSTRSN